MNKIAVVDIETTGFINQGGLIVEIGIVGLDLETGLVLEEYNQIVHEEGFGISHTKSPLGWIFNNSDLTYDEVLNSPLLRNELPAIQKIFDKFPAGATAFNKKFDFAFLTNRGIKLKELPCIMLAACPVVNLPPNRGYSTPKWPKVEEAWEYFFPNTPYKEAHRAADDAYHEALILCEMWNRGKYQLPETEA